MKSGRKIQYVLCLLLVVVCICAGCGKPVPEFKKNQVLRVDKQYSTKAQAMVLLCAMQKNYEKSFGGEAWKQQFGDGTLEEYIKEQVKTQLVQLSSLALLAEEKKITLTDDEKDKVSKASETLCNSFSEESKKTCGFQLDDVKKLYEQYALSMKVYEQITSEVESEISDDEARRIDVQVIFLKTTYLDENKQEQNMSEEQKLAVVQKGNEALKMIKGGAEFSTVAAKFQEGDRLEYHIGRGEMGEAFDKAAFQLSNGQVSGLVKEEKGIYIIKCLSNYNKEETDANKKKLYEEACTKAFNDTYDKFMKGKKVKVNDKVWSQVKVISGVDLPEIDFVQIYEKLDTQSP